MFKPLKSPKAPPAPPFPSQLISPHAPKPTSEIRIVFQNINGWKTNCHSLRPAYSKINPDVILLADTGQENTSRIKLHPYLSYQTKNLEGHKAGVAILIRPEIQHQIIKDPFIQDTIAVRIETTSGPIIVATCYHPPRFKYPPFKDLDWLANHLLPTYLLADLNCHHPTFHNSAKVSGPDKERGLVFYEEWIQPYKLIRHGPTFPTFLRTSNSGTTPDIVLSNNKIYHNHHIAQLPPNTSDHLGIKFTISVRPIVKTVKCEDEKKADWDAFSDFVEERVRNLPESVTKLWNCTAPEALAALKECSDILTDARLECIPQVKVCTRPFIPSSPRFNRLTKILNLHNQTLLTSNDPLLWVHARRQITKINVMLRHEGRILMDVYWVCLINDAAQYLSTDPKQYWKKLLRLRGTSRGTIKITVTGKPGGARILSDIDKQRALFEKFAPRFEKTNEENISPESMEEMESYFEANPDIFLPYPTADFQRFIDSTVYDRQFSPGEIYSLIHSGQSKTGGEEGHKKVHLRHTPKNFLVLLTHIYSACLALGISPDNMKCALMVFISKPGKDPCDPGNYRPLCLLPILGKIYDAAITGRFTCFVEDHDLQHPNQYGFRKGRGTATALAMSYEWIARQKAKFNARVTMVARDIKGAFDFLPHRRIKYHLARINLPPMLLKVLGSFLDNRTAKIKVGSYIGPSFPLRAGVPQGASPSAAIFNLCVRGAPSPASRVNQYWSQYADDTTQLIKTVQSSWKQNVHDMEVIKAVQIMNDFERNEGLITEPQKSWLLSFGTPHPPLVKVDGHEYQTPPKNVGRLLGHHFTHNNMITKQVEMQAHKAACKLGTLWGFRRASTRIKVHVIKALVFPHLTYPCIPLHTAGPKQMGILQSKQNAAIKFAFNISWYDFISAKDLHNRFRFKFKPLNQVLHLRAQQTWDKIKSGIGADPEQFKIINETLAPEPDEKYDKSFPSSLDLAEKDEPPPLYTYSGSGVSRTGRSPGNVGRPRTRPAFGAAHQHIRRVAGRYLRRVRPAVGATHQHIRNVVRGYLRRGASRTGRPPDSPPSDSSPGSP